MWQNLLKLSKDCHHAVQKKSVNQLFKITLVAVRQVHQRCFLQSSLWTTYNTNDFGEYGDFMGSTSSSIINDPRISKHKFIQNLKHCYHLTEENINQIISNEEIKDLPTGELLWNLKILFDAGVSRNAILKNVWLYKLDKGRLSQSISLISSIDGLRNINDFVPFMRLQGQRLGRFVSILNTDYKEMGEVNRIYYLADKLQLEPILITEHVVKRLFILKIPLEIFKINLQTMIDYNIEPLNILKDLWSFRYTPQLVETRLSRARLAKKDPVMPWMIRCPEDIFERSLQISRNEVQILDGKNTAVEYIAERLGFTVPETQGIMNRHPQVHTVRITKIKEMLDYLLNEAGYTRSDVALVPRILCHGLKTTKQRLEQLQKYDYRPLTLSIVCRSKREYNKFLQNLIESKSKTQNENKEEVTG